MKRFRTRCKCGDLIEITASNGTVFHCVVLMASTTYKDLILIGVPSVPLNGPRFGPAILSSNDIAALIYTSSMPLKTGRWRVVGNSTLFEGFEYLSLRTTAGTIWCDNTQGAQLANELARKLSFLPELDCAGSTLVESCLAYLNDKSDESNYARKIQSKSTAFLKRFAELKEIWDTID